VHFLHFPTTHAPPNRPEFSSGAAWVTGGAPEAESAITGTAGDFCRVAAQRLGPARSGLRASGPQGAIALRVLRTYAA
jgi:hypothetical protein